MLPACHQLTIAGLDNFIGSVPVLQCVRVVRYIVTETSLHQLRVGMSYFKCHHVLEGALTIDNQCTVASGS